MYEKEKKQWGAHLGVLVGMAGYIGTMAPSESTSDIAVFLNGHKTGCHRNYFNKDSVFN